MRKSGARTVGEINWPTTALLAIGCITILFPFYTAIMIAFKNSTEMTNDTAGILSPPQCFSLSNLAEVMRVTDFWCSLGNSLFITGIVILLSVVIHSLADYAIGRNMGHSKFYSLAYLYIVSGMFVPFAVLIMPLVKQTAQLGIVNRVGVILLYIVFHMLTNLLLHSGYLENIPITLEEATRVNGASTWRTYWYIIFPIMKPIHTTVVVLTALGTWNNVMMPLVIISSSGSDTPPLAQSTFQNQFGTNYNLAFVSYLLVLLPILAFYSICQKQILNGVVNGVVK